MLEYSILGLAGASMGSFIAAFADRWPRGKSLLSRSGCSTCHERIRFYDLVPVVSYIALWGRCRTCGKAIPLSVFVMEVLALLITAGVFGTLGISWSSLALVVALFSLLAICVVDWQSYLIPDAPLAVIAGCSIAQMTLRGGISFETYALGAFLLPSILWFLGQLTTRLLGRESLGFGDVKMAAAVGLAVGLLGGFLAIWIAATLGLIYKALGIRRDDPRIPFGSMMAVSTTLVLLVDFEVVILPWIQ